MMTAQAAAIQRVEGMKDVQTVERDGFVFDRIVTGDARCHLAKLPAGCVDLSFWSPPYYVGKSYERHLSFDDWRGLLRDVIRCHSRIVKPGGFLAVNIGDILCYPDPAMPRFQADNMRRKTWPVTREQVLAAKQAHPNANRRELAAHRAAAFGGQQRARRQAGCLDQGCADGLHGARVGGASRLLPLRSTDLA